MMLRRWAVREHLVSGAYVRLSSNFAHNTSRGSSCAFLGYLNFDLLLVQNYDLFRRFDAHFVSGADLEKYWADDSHIAHTCSLRSLVVPFQVFGP